MKKRSTIILLWLVFFTPGVRAGAFPNSGGKADNKRHFVCWDAPGSYTAELTSYLWYLNITVYGQSGMHAYAQACAPLVNAWFDNTMSSSNPAILGLRYCRVSSGNICIEADVMIEESNITAAAQFFNIPVANLKEKVWCHETGHSFGLKHHSKSGSQDCMKSGAHDHLVYKPHHINHHLSNNIAAWP